MNPLRSRAIRSALVTLTLAASPIAVAAPAQAATAPCTIEGATMDWGFKESFRAYIDGSIANGEWTTADGASYATPEFSWDQEFGEIDSAGSARFRFTGSVRFTGHEGLLDTTIANPIVSLEPDGSARVALDVSGPTMEGDQIHENEVPFLTGKVSADDITTVDGLQTIVIVAPELTEQGSTAFPNYEAGTAFDDLTLHVAATEDCRVTLAPAVPLWIMAGVASGVVLAGVAVLLAVLRKRKAATDA